MVLNFVDKVFSINGGGDVTSPFTFYKNGFELGSLKAPEPTWQDIIISGNTALTLVNAKADGLPLEVSYKGGVSVTITEVQNANLSNSVTVTIGE